MTFALIKNNQVVEYPCSLIKFRQDNSQVSLPLEPTEEQLNEQGIYTVNTTKQPQVDIRTQNLNEVTPTFNNEKCNQSWSVTEKTDAEKAAYVELVSNEIREQRNQLLVENVDKFNAVRWAVLTPEQQQQWIDYRQALLDIPEQSGFPFNIIWPNTPF